MQTREQLLHVTLYLRQAKLHTWPFRQPGEVVIHVLKHQVNAPLVSIRRVRLRGDDLFQINHVFVPKFLQDFNLSNSRDWEPFLLVVHSNLL